MAASLGRRRDSEIAAYTSHVAAANWLVLTTAFIFMVAVVIVAVKLLGNK